MKTIGITGLTGAGKTSALDVLKEMGAMVIDCDALYHTLLRTSVPMRQELEARFGSLGDGEVDRKKLGKAVFGNPKALADLSRITHRYVREETGRLLGEYSAAGWELAAVDAVALLESGLGKDCDKVVLVTAPEEVRAKRIMERESISREYAMLRIRAQKPESWFCPQCDMILENTFPTLEAFKAYCRERFMTMLEEMNHG